MDRVAEDRVVSARPVRGMAALLLLVLLAVGSACHRYERAAPPTPSALPPAEERAGDNTAPAAEPAWLHPAVAIDEAAGGKETPPADATPPDAATGRTPEPVASLPSPPPEVKAEPTGAPPRGGAPPAPSPPAHKPRPGTPAHPGPPEPAKVTRDGSLPGWAKSPEELVYRVDFIGITMGYARFRYQGKVSIGGKATYHLNVRAWTSGVLSYIYPINETIDYYLDTETIAPIRQDSTKQEREKDDVAFYDQETGKITVRYRQSGEIRREVTTVPSVYDPVSVAYYFRWKDLGLENRSRNVYGGRKLYQISSRILGNERIRTEYGEVDTIVVLPLIYRDGKPDDKGDLRIWFSRDERHVPVRLYAKFRKIKEWTLVGELVRPAGKAGG